MTVLHDMVNTIRYWLSPHKEPVFDNAERHITRFTPDIFTPGDTDAFDTNNYQRFTDGPGALGMFPAERVSQEVTTKWYWEWIAQCKAYGQTNTRIQHNWTYKSTACHSHDKFRLDIYKPGRIVVKSTLPKLGCASVWLYSSENPGDFGKEWIPQIDRAGIPKDYYFEIDIFETFRNWTGQRIGMAGHYGDTQKNRKMKNESVCGKFSGYHYPEIRWDGNGNWEWFLNNVLIHTEYIPFPDPKLYKIYPYLKMTYMVMEPWPAEITYSAWFVEYIKISNTIKL